jgi:hypothetical protein
MMGGLPCSSYVIPLSAIIFLASITFLRKNC